MNDQPDRLRHVLEAIDAANAKDPHLVEEEGRQVPAEWLYGQRMGATLADLVPEASEALTIAARGQHIERWTSLRTAYPAGRMGYLRWRTDLKAYHAQRLAELMAEHGFDQETIDRVGALVRKERLKQDAEVQALEDVVMTWSAWSFSCTTSPTSQRSTMITRWPTSWRRLGARCRPGVTLRRGRVA